MTIELYSGTPGSGKSYHAMLEILDQLDAGKDVIANFPLKFSKRQLKKGYDKRFLYLRNDEITIERLLGIALERDYVTKRKEGLCLVVIDEAGGRFNTREWARSDRREWNDFFSQHMKFGYDILLVAQRDRMLDKQIRGFIENEVNHRKLNHYQWFRFLPFTIFIAVRYWYQQKERQNAELLLFSKRIANHYDRWRLFDGFALSPALLAVIEQAKAKAEGRIPQVLQAYEPAGSTIDVIYSSTEETENAAG